MSGLLLCVFASIALATCANAAISSKAIELINDGHSYDFEFLRNFTRYLQEKHDFNNFVTYAKDRVQNRQDLIVIRSLEQALVADFEVPIIVWSMDGSARFRNVIGTNNLVFVEFDNITDPILDVVDKTLEGLHFISILFFYKDQNNMPPTIKEIHEFFAWCWQRNMINVALYFQLINVRVRGKFVVDIRVQNQLFYYSPFPVLTVYNMTEQAEQCHSSFLIGRISEVKGYNFITPFAASTPYIYGTPGKNSIIQGTVGRLYSEYIRSINGSIKIVSHKRRNYIEYLDYVMEAIVQKVIDIGLHPFSGILAAERKTDGSYPIAQTNACLIIPVVREMNRGHYLLRPFQLPMWLLVMVTFISLMVLQFYFGQRYAPFSRNPLTLCSYALITTVSMMLNQALINQLVFKHSTFYKFLHVLVLTLTFILSNLYVASLTSLLSISPMGGQIDTLAEFLASGLEILIAAKDKEYFFDSGLMPVALLPRVRIVDQGSSLTNLWVQNTSFAYVISAERWQMFNYYQRQLRKPLFRMPSAELCSAPFFLKLPIQKDSPFTLSLALFFMATQESGLNLKWQDITLSQIKQHKFFIDMTGDDEPWKPLNLAHFTIVGRFICVIWLLLILCLIIEILWFYWCEKQKKSIAIEKKTKLIWMRYFKRLSRK